MALRLARTPLAAVIFSVGFVAHTEHLAGSWSSPPDTWLAASWDRFVGRPTGCVLYADPSVVIFREDTDGRVSMERASMAPYSLLDFFGTLPEAIATSDGFLGATLLFHRPSTTERGVWAPTRRVYTLPENLTAPAFTGLAPERWQEARDAVVEFERTAEWRVFDDRHCAMLRAGVAEREEILWGGYAHNLLALVLFVGSAWSLMRMPNAVRSGRRLVLQAHRREQGVCVSCGYDPTGLTRGVCPECGSAL